MSTEPAWVHLKVFRQPADYPSHVQVLVEWCKGEHRRDVWQAEQQSLVFLRQDDTIAPVNYGCLPYTYNPADHAEIDVIVLGAPQARGTMGLWQPVGLVYLDDQDHKLLVAADPTQDYSADVQAVLDWFPAQRGAHILEASAALSWLASMPIVADTSV